jgi:hypothetical protein
MPLRHTPELPVLALLDMPNDPRMSANWGRPEVVAQQKRRD